MNEGIFQPEHPPEIAIVQQNRVGSHQADSVASAEDLRMVEALRRGNESAFVSLIDRYHASMLRLAMVFVPSQAVAEEVVQEAWMGVLQGLNRFEGRSSLKTWIFRILTNRAKTRAQREGRSVPFSSLPEFNSDLAEPAVDTDRFRGPDQQWPGNWISFPRSWDEIPEERILSQETLARIQDAIDALPPGQREVITLRDIEGLPSDETCNLLGVSEANQRVLLHRARCRVRRALERYFEEE
ncbi:MAG TPA: sigma-70 family RNA polymerase sigma factor [Ktedonobacteraceae bacterium]